MSFVQYNSNDIANEIKSMISQIENIDKEIKVAIPNFRQTYKNCDFASEWQGKGLMSPQYLKLICEKGYSYFNQYILNPLLISLLDYRDHLLGVKAYTSSYKTKIQGLLSAIHRYVIVTSFFGKNPSYMIPGNSPREIQFQNEFKRIILQINRRLMGCDNSNLFPIQDIASKFGMEGDHQKILEYMENQCVFLRKELL